MNEVQGLKAVQVFKCPSSEVRCFQGGDTSEYQTVVDNFVTWCELNHLQLNVRKTKELVVDFIKSRTPVTPLSVHGEEVEIVADYIYL